MSSSRQKLSRLRYRTNCDATLQSPSLCFQFSTIASESLSWALYQQLHGMWCHQWCLNWAAGHTGWRGWCQGQTCSVYSPSLLRQQRLITHHYLLMSRLRDPFGLVLWSWCGFETLWSDPLAGHLASILNLYASCLDISFVLSGSNTTSGVGLPPCYSKCGCIVPTFHKHY